MQSKIFCDPIHSHIELPPLCVKIVDTPQFQRLRFIKQLGNVAFVFPGATHSRFEHSLGVCHLAGKLAQKLLSLPVTASIPNDEKKKRTLAVQIAGLCHDLGHGPKSHTFEKIASTYRKANGGSQWKHEEASIGLIDHLIKENSLEDDLKEEFGEADYEQYIQFIKDCISGKTERKHTDEQSVKDRWFLYEIVANKESEIDVDKWDYFSRDCYMTGLSHSFDYIRAIDTAGVVYEADGYTHIGWREKEAFNLYEMFHTRFRLHRVVYQHRVSNMIDMMESEALELANDALIYYDKDGKSYNFLETVDNMEVYSLTNDDVFTKILALNSNDDTKTEEQNEKIVKAQTILKRILKRDIPVMIAHKPTNDDDQTLVERLKKELTEECKVEDDQIKVHVVKFNYCKGKEDPVATYVKLFAKDAPTVPKRLDKRSVSLMLPSLFDERQIRLYCNRQVPQEKQQRLRNVFDVFMQTCAQNKRQRTK